MRELAVHIGATISDATARVRAECFPGPDGVGGELFDAFDARSVHVCIRESGRRLAAYARLTPGPPGVFSSWSSGAAELPSGEDVTDLGRCMVTPGYRGLKLFRAICLEGVIEAHRQGFREANGAYVVTGGDGIARTLRHIGF